MEAAAAAAEEAARGPSSPTSAPQQHEEMEAADAPRPRLGRLLLRVQCVDLVGGDGERGVDALQDGSGGAGGGGGGASMVSPRQSRRQALLGEGVCEVVALTETTARSICRCVSMFVVIPECGSGQVKT